MDIASRPQPKVSHGKPIPKPRWALESLGAVRVGAACAAAVPALVVVILVNITGYALVDEANQQRIHLKRQLAVLRSRNELYRTRIIDRTREATVDQWAREHNMVRLIDQYRYVGQADQMALAQPEGRYRHGHTDQTGHLPAPPALAVSGSHRGLRGARAPARLSPGLPGRSLPAGRG